MYTVGADEAKMEFPAILSKVINGEDVIITLHGVPVADMRRHSGQDGSGAETAVAEIMELRKEFAGVFEGENVKMLMEEGRR